MQFKLQTYTVGGVRKTQTSKLHHSFNFFISNYVLQASSTSLTVIGRNSVYFIKISLISEQGKLLIVIPFVKSCMFYELNYN